MRLASIAILISLGTLAAAQQPKKATTPAPKTMATKPAAKTPAPAAKTHAAPAAKTHAAAPAKTAAKPAAKAPAQAAVQKPAPKQIAAKPAPKKAEHNAAAPKPSAAKANEAPEMTHVAGRRDPFISPVRLQDEKLKSNPACSTGARCLVISQVVLKGVIKTPSGMIAMVENGAKKEYNLHERDVVQNGSVMKITGDSIVFQESGTDPLGRPVLKEVVKRVTVPAV
jgi:hypothetical protein